MYKSNEIKLKRKAGMKPGLMEYHTTMKELGCKKNKISIEELSWYEINTVCTTHTFITVHTNILWTIVRRWKIQAGRSIRAAR